ncbi:hypothetical protein [Halioxenophilus sp. WMMB6]|uniref:GNAT family N-acetyltransferase n=1 Tax=Halioxenophilus sp. WMMB6 TaxID=3073815 RepID=UPI00295ECDBC|nr:hypothetical protein [Halioxenophilus sp. WMMB6]
MTETAVIRVQRDKRYLLAEVLAQAFMDEPALSWMVPNQADRQRTYTRFFYAIVSGSQRHGLALQTPDNQAITLWRLPGRSAPGLWETLCNLPRMLPMLGCAGERAKVMSRAVREHWPTMPFRYLQFAGVAPDAQGLGKGGVVIRAGLQLAEAAGEPVYLETAKAKNVGLYRSLGFEVIDEWQIAETPLRFTSMLRGA